MYFYPTVAPTAQVYLLEAMAARFLPFPSHCAVYVIAQYFDTELVKLSHSLVATERKKKRQNIITSFKISLSEYPGSSSFGVQPPLVQNYVLTLDKRCLIFYKILDIAGMCTNA